MPRESSLKPNNCFTGEQDIPTGQLFLFSSLLFFFFFFSLSPTTIHSLAVSRRMSPHERGLPTCKFILFETRRENKSWTNDSDRFEISVGDNNETLRWETVVGKFMFKGRDWRERRRRLFPISFLWIYANVRNVMVRILLEINILRGETLGYFISFYDFVKFSKKCRQEIIILNISRRRFLKIQL